ncbi:MAG: DNA integrity scanning diadenylate cyclase DisA [Firmicutes bacterium]|nr:DNA integrity scanning diadenylate cyclase DisA [Bacillota bacterium]
MMSQAMLDFIAKVAPGTALREAIDNIIRARTGALIVIGGEPDIDEDCEAGFKLDVPFHHTLVYELAKMDGAILLDADIKKIRRANVELLPKRFAITTETGMRHRTAERIARTRDVLVIAISERRSVVSLYCGSERYLLHDLSYILTKASGAFASLGRYDRLFRSAARRVQDTELTGSVPLMDVVELLRRASMTMKIRQEISRYILELGRDGHLIDLQLEEYPDIRREWCWLWKDYQAQNDGIPLDPYITDSDGWSAEEWIQHLGYSALDNMVHPRGYRLLHGIPRLPDSVIDNLIRHYGSMKALREASVEDLDQVEGVGPQRARAIWNLFHDTVPISQ